MDDDYNADRAVAQQVAPEQIAPQIGETKRSEVFRLTGANYTSWKFQMERHFKARGLFKVVMGVEDDSARDIRAQDILVSSLSQDHILRVIDCSTSAEMWARLESIYENKTPYEKQELMKAFNNYRIGKRDDMGKAIGEIQSLGVRLKALGAAVDDDWMMSAIVCALPEN